MLSKITCDILDAQQHCRLKAYFQFCGDTGIKSDLEQMLFEMRQELRSKAIAKILRQYAREGFQADIRLSIAALRQGIPLANFFEDVSERNYESDASKALQERLLRNRDRLFTFINHDGVSWNNNLAENAIKQFWPFREDAGTAIKEAGLAEHLVLLSVYGKRSVAEWHKLPRPSSTLPTRRGLREQINSAYWAV